jgi:hypothetical protein
MYVCRYRLVVVNFSQADLIPVVDAYALPMCALKIGIACRHSECVLDTEHVTSALVFALVMLVGLATTVQHVSHLLT